jgi:hypothetical protein
MIIISQEKINEILSVIGYPVLSLSDIKELGSEEQFKQNIVWPSLRTFFQWFPIVENEEYQISGQFDIDFPDSNTFTVVDSRLNTAGFVARDSNNPFLNNSIYRSVTSSTGYGGGQYGTMNDYDMAQVRIYQRMERQSNIDLNKAFKVDVDLSNKKVSGFTNVTGRLIIKWGKYSEDFSKVPLRWESDVINLCKSKLLINLAMIRGQMTANIPSNFNYQLFLDEGKRIETEVLKRFKSISKVVLLRN